MKGVHGHNFRISVPSELFQASKDAMNLQIKLYAVYLFIFSSIANELTLGMWCYTLAIQSLKITQYAKRNEKKAAIQKLALCTNKGQ